MNKAIAPSFRDPSGFLFTRAGTLYRQVNLSYKSHYDSLMTNGLYDKLTSEQMLIAHQEIPPDASVPAPAYRIIKPEFLPFISYPYEWCFSQLKDAALLTLTVQKTALQYGMSLKDASAYNIQFRKGRPILIDTLSFEKHSPLHPWVAYRQFCQHFLAPLALMSYVDIRLSQLLKIHLDGLPLDLAAALLPLRARLNPGIFLHLCLHAQAQKRWAGKSTHNASAQNFSLNYFYGLVESLETLIRKLRFSPAKSLWGDYYAEKESYVSPALAHKQEVVAAFLDEIKPRTIWDLGANTGLFSRLAAAKNIEVIAFDIDYLCVERNYLSLVKDKETRILPLVLDLSNPTPAIGWENEERANIIDRGPADLAVALALIHHLAITHNLGFDKIAHFLGRTARHLVIEFVPKDDPMVQKLLAAREDIFSDYTLEAFERAFSVFFKIRQTVKIKDSRRILYLMEKINA